MPEFLLQSENKFEIDIDPTGQSQLVPLAAGITNVDPDINDELNQDKYYDGKGFGETDVVSSQLIITFSGHRLYGDPAQDYIFNTLMETGVGRRTTLRWTTANGDKFSGPVTIANITGPSGEAGSKGEIGFEVHFNGKPEYIPQG